ncbi:hypothetical protein JTE90_022441 [Oedothorax gibbosus]|uniref:THAP-type domain-containing protein n=1 Tax=Oedothorax gibbosus TaxID=931172 RepID=A0AAV6TT37_9ARAC|nr:hypothetical protein JTE90_022441 [Oedothorax gibbosus]
MPNVLVEALPLPATSQQTGRFPFSRHEVYEKWVHNLRRENFTPSSSSVLCSDHFEDSCFERSGTYVLSRKDAVPTLFDIPAPLQKVTKKRKRCDEEAGISNPNPEIHHLKRQLVTSGKRTEIMKKTLKVKKQKIRRLQKRMQSLKYLVDQ